MIALFKLLKAIVLILAGLSSLHLFHKNIANVRDHWVARFGLDPGKQYVDRALQKASNLSPNKIKDMGIVSLIYAGLFRTEGIGLWMMKP